MHNIQFLMMEALSLIDKCNWKSTNYCQLTICTLKVNVIHVYGLKQIKNVISISTTKRFLLGLALMSISPV